MLNFVQEKIRETRGLYDTPPAGVGSGFAAEAFDWPPPLEASAPAPDAEIDEMARKFEQMLGQPAPPREEHSRAAPLEEEFRFELSADDEQEAARLARFAQPRPAGGMCAEPMRVQRLTPREPDASGPSHAPSIPGAPHPARVRSKSAAMIAGVAVALAVGAGAGFIAAKGTGSSDSAAKIDIPAGSGAAGLRLDYELKQPRQGQHRKP